MWAFLFCIVVFYPLSVSADGNGTFVDNSTDCDIFASRTTINATHDFCECESDFIGNGTSCDLLLTVDCSTDVINSGYAFKVRLNQTYIDYKGISISTLRLLNESCNNVTLEGGYYVLQSPEYDECGSVQTNTSDTIIYSNEVQNNGGGISSGEILTIPFSCFILADISISMGDNDTVPILLDAVAGQNIIFPVQGSAGTVTASMYLYKDANYAEVYNGVPVLSTTDTVYVKIALDSVLNGLYIISRECWATPDAQGVSSERFDIIEEPGCLKSSVTKGLLTRNGVSEESRFQLAVFTFLPSNVVYLHCQIELCNPPDGGTCEPSCSGSGRKRRAASGNIGILRSQLMIRSSHRIYEPGTISTGSDENGDNATDDRTLLLVILIALLVMLVLVVAILFGYIFFVRRRKST